MSAEEEEEEEGIDPATFERLSPSLFLSFSFPNPLPSPSNPYSPTLRVAVADSPSSTAPPSPPAVAALLVPHSREHDWIFSTPAGHFQLLLSLSSPSLPISRLVLIGDLPSSLPQPYSRNPNPSSLHPFQESLLPLLFALCPKSSFSNGIPSIPFLSYDDDIIFSSVVEKLVGPIAGEMLVEDVQIEKFLAMPERRRWLRFKRMPNLVQSDVRLLPDSVDGGVFRPETGSLVQPYLVAMAAALSVNAPAVNDAFQSGCLPWALCLGVGGGLLPMSLRCHFGFGVLGVEADDVVLGVARRHFGLVEDEFLKVIVGDGIKFIEDIGERQECKLFHAIMVDLDAEDPMNGFSAPAVGFLQKGVLVRAKLALHREGILVVNVMSSAEAFYARVIDLFRDFFCELYEVDVGNGENCVLIATASPVRSFAKEMEKESPLHAKLKQLDCGRFLDGIRKI